MAGTEVHALTGAQRDALCEVANIGAGHAATALSLMTGGKILVSVPRIIVAPLGEIAPELVGPDELIVVIPMRVTGSIQGDTILMLPMNTARWLTALVTRRDPADVMTLGALASSALTEAGNIIAGAYLTALSEFLDMLLLPSPPSLTVGPARDVLLEAATQRGHHGGNVFCVETRFLIDAGDHLPGYFFLLPADGALDAMLAALRMG